jgi:hypothetical protein
MIDETRLLAADSAGTARLAQVLARETSCDEVRIREPIELGHIRLDGDAEALAQNALRTRLDLTEEYRFVTRFVQPKFDTPDACEEASHAKGPLKLSRSHRLQTHSPAIFRGRSDGALRQQALRARPLLLDRRSDQRSAKAASHL